jgi:hypothetical protein
MIIFVNCPNCEHVFQLDSTELLAKSGSCSCPVCALKFDGYPHISVSDRSEVVVLEKEKQAKNNGNEIKKKCTASKPILPTVAYERQSPAQRPLNDKRVDGISLFESVYIPPPKSKTNGIVLVILLLITTFNSLYFLLPDLYTRSSFASNIVDAACREIKCPSFLLMSSSALNILNSELKLIEQKKNIYRLSVNLSNRAKHRVAYPVLQLSLYSEKGLESRKNIKPSDYLSGVYQINHGFEGLDEKQIKIQFELKAPDAVDFRIFFFYEKAGFNYFG